MIIAGLQKQSLIEYPGKISTIVFLAGCNLRCQYCYVPHLVLPERIKKIKPISQKKFFLFLKERKNFLEAVVVSGGEATINKELPDFLKEVKKMGYLVELETNGTNPEMLRFLIEKKLVDYLAMDIKHDLVYEKYREITGNVLTKKLFEKIKKSIKIIHSAKIDYEFRTTLVKEFHRPEDIINLCQKIKRVKKYYLQNYQPQESVSGKIFHPLSEEEIEKIKKEGQKFVNLEIRKYL